MPAEVRKEIGLRGVRGRDYASRNTPAFRRQGEWFFVPREGLSVRADYVNRNEMLQRGRGKPHYAEFGYRIGGDTVYATPSYMNGQWISVERFQRLVKEQPELGRLSWRTARANMQVYVKGRVRHPDHATINLWCWHEVLMNTESTAPAMKHLAFVD
jgi:hypothetical protein